MRRSPSAACTALLVLMPATGLAQSGGPTVAIDITAADIQATLDSPDGGIDRQIRILDMGVYNLAVGIIHRGANAGDGPVTGIIHSQVTETYYITSGTGELVTGGTMVNGRDLPRESEVVRILNGPTSFGANEGGRHRTVSEGDVIVIPAGVFHGWGGIPDHVTYLSVRPDPDKVLEAGYVNPAVER